MTFFINQSANEEPEEERNPVAAPHSGKATPLFKQEPVASEHLLGGRLSLSAYISRHLDLNAESTPGLAVSPDGPPQASKNTSKPNLSQSPQHTEIEKADVLHATPQEAADQHASHSTRPSGQGVTGQYLNTLDGELTAGLEQYMPTPLFRLRVTKNRLDKELRALRGQLTKYERLPHKTPDMVERIQSLKYRLQVLEAHDRQVSQELNGFLAWGPWIHGIATLAAHVNALWHQPNPLFQAITQQWLIWIYGADYLAVADANNELRDLQNVLSDRLRDSQVSQEELGQLLSRHDQLYERARHQMAGVSSRFQNRWLLGAPLPPTSGKIKESR